SLAFLSVGTVTSTIPLPGCSGAGTSPRASLRSRSPVCAPAWRPAVGPSSPAVGGASGEAAEGGSVRPWGATASSLCAAARPYERKESATQKGHSLPRALPLRIVATCVPRADPCDVLVPRHYS